MKIYHQRIFIDPAYSQIIERLYQSFSERQRISLAEEILHYAPRSMVSIDLSTQHPFFDQLGVLVEEFHDSGEGL